jgi:hypothetical protein
MRRIIPLLAGVLLVLTSGHAVAQTNEQAAAEVIALAKAQWAAEMANQPTATVMKDVADEYTEFSPTFPRGLTARASTAGSARRSPMIRAARWPRRWPTRRYRCTGMWRS